MRTVRIKRALIRKAELAEFGWLGLFLGGMPVFSMVIEDGFPKLAVWKLEKAFHHCDGPAIWITRVDPL